MGDIEVHSILKEVLPYLQKMPSEQIVKIIDTFNDCKSVQKTADAYGVDWKLVADIMYLHNYGQLKNISKD